MVGKSAAKGARAEVALVKLLQCKTGEDFQRTPSSGALGANLKMKGDIFIPQCANCYTIEAKHYKECHYVVTMLANRSNTWLYEWWPQTIREAMQNENEPLLMFKHDRSKWYVTTLEKPENTKYIYHSETETYTCLLEPWLENEEIVWKK